MSVIVDSSFIYALLNQKDRRHFDALRFSLTHTEELLVPDVVLPERSYLFRRDFGYAGVQRFLELIPSIGARYVPIVGEDISRMHEKTILYGDAAFDIVDCCRKRNQNAQRVHPSAIPAAAINFRSAPTAAAIPSAPLKPLECRASSRCGSKDSTPS